MQKSLAVALVLAGCGAGANPAVDAKYTEAAVAAIKQNSSEAMAAHAAGDAQRWAGLFDAEAVLMPEGAASVAGRDAIAKWIGGLYAANTVVMKEDTKEINVAGDWAFSRDEFAGTLTPKGGGAATQLVGKELIIWHHQADGSWKASRAIFNSNAAALEGIFDYVGDMKGQAVVTNGRYSFIYAPAKGGAPTAEAGTYKVVNDTAVAATSYSTIPAEAGLNFRWTITGWSADTADFVAWDNNGKVLAKGRAVKRR